MRSHVSILGCSSVVRSDLRWSAGDAGGPRMKSKTIGYWVTTGLLVFCMTGGIFELLGLKTTTDGIMRLGYPPYIIPALGLGKVLAILAILWPGFPRLKEWAYAGILFNMLGALVSHVASKDPAWSVAVTATIAALTMASWFLRPDDRKLVGALKPVEVAQP